MTALHVRHLDALVDYRAVWQAMRRFTDQRTSTTPDELWLLSHHPVLTQGQAGKPEHLRIPSDIPVVQSDRGGQITYHGPGQLVAYLLFDLRRLGCTIRQLVSWSENAIIAYLSDRGITATADPKAPGVYVDGAKICALGLRVSKGCSFHGLAFNINMDLTPFATINPCGYAGLKVTQLQAMMETIVTVSEVAHDLIPYLANQFKHTPITQTHYTTWEQMKTDGAL